MAQAWLNRLPPTLAALALASAAAAQTLPAPAAKQPEPPPQISYMPPPRGAPEARVGGAARDITIDDLTIAVVAPEGVALTTRAQPTLYWFSSGPLQRPVRFVIEDGHAPEPLYAVEIPAPTPAGFHPVRLANTAVKLAPERDYRWSIVLAAASGHREMEPTVTGWIRRVKADLDTDERKFLSREGAAALLAKNGIWYDALDQLSAASPTATDRLMRQKLLEQIDLPAAASFDREATAAK